MRGINAEQIAQTYLKQTRTQRPGLAKPSMVPGGANFKFAKQDGRWVAKAATPGSAEPLIVAKAVQAAKAIAADGTKAAAPATAVASIINAAQAANTGKPTGVAGYFAGWRRH